MSPIIWLALIVIVFIVLPGFKVVQQYEKGVVFLLGKIKGIRELTWEKAK